MIEFRFHALAQLYHKKFSASVRLLLIQKIMKKSKREILLFSPWNHLKRVYVWRHKNRDKASKHDR